MQNQACSSSSGGKASARIVKTPPSGAGREEAKNTITIIFWGEKKIALVTRTDYQCIRTKQDLVIWILYGTDDALSCLFSPGNVHYPHASG